MWQGPWQCPGQPYPPWGSQGRLRACPDGSVDGSVLRGVGEQLIITTATITTIYVCSKLSSFLFSFIFVISFDPHNHPEGREGKPHDSHWPQWKQAQEGRGPAQVAPRWVMEPQVFLWTRLNPGPLLGPHTGPHTGVISQIESYTFFFVLPNTTLLTYTRLR